jgi:hypothetical protein
VCLINKGKIRVEKGSVLLCLRVKKAKEQLGLRNFTLMHLLYIALKQEEEEEEEEEYDDDDYDEVRG